MKLRLSVPDTALSSEDRTLIVRKAEQLASGELGEDGAKLLESQKSFANTTRSNQIALLESRPDIKRQLQSITADQLSRWFDGETKRPAGTAISPLLLSHNTQVVNYDRKAPIDEWLIKKLMEPKSVPAVYYPQPQNSRR